MLPDEPQVEKIVHAMYLSCAACDSMLWKKFDTKVNFSSTHHPQSNGQTKVINRTLGAMLCSLAGNKPKQWDLSLPKAEFAFNSMVNWSTGKAPFEIVYTKPPYFTTDLLQLPSPLNKLAEALANRISSTLDTVRLNLTESTTAYKAQVDLHHQDKRFAEGNLVMVHLHCERFPTGEYNKLQARKFDLYRILHKISDNAYIVDLPASWNINSTFNVMDLFEYYPFDATPEAPINSVVALEIYANLRTSCSQAGVADARASYASDTSAL